MTSYTSLRAQLGEALRPIRLALHNTEDGAHTAVEFMGYRFTGCRLYKARGQIGFAWNANYSGEPMTDENRSRWPTNQFGCIGGGLDACATQLHSRLRAEASEAAHVSGVGAVDGAHRGSCGVYDASGYSDNRCTCGVDGRKP